MHFQFLYKKWKTEIDNIKNQTISFNKMNFYQDIINNQHSIYLPINLSTRQLEMPVKPQRSLNELSLNLQLQNIQFLRNTGESHTICCEAIPETYSQYHSTHTHESCGNMAVQEAGNAKVISITSSESGIKELDESSSEFTSSKSSIVNQYSHEVISRYNDKLSKTQKVFVCRYKGCGKEFTKSWNLVYHARIHTNEKPFKCQDCRESFAQKGNLKRHMKIHAETALAKRKRFQCSVCLKKYTTKFNLKVHKQTKHNDFEIRD